MVADGVALAAGGDLDLGGEVPAEEAAVPCLDADVVLGDVRELLAPRGGGAQAVPPVAVVAHPPRLLRARLVAGTAVLLALQSRLQDPVRAPEVYRAAARLRAHAAREFGQLALRMRIAARVHKSKTKKEGDAEEKAGSQTKHVGVKVVHSERKERNGNVPSGVVLYCTAHSCKLERRVRYKYVARVVGQHPTYSVYYCPPGARLFTCCISAHLLLSFVHMWRSTWMGCSRTPSRPDQAHHCAMRHLSNSFLQPCNAISSRVA